jgi:septum formation protein
MSGPDLGDAGNLQRSNDARTKQTRQTRHQDGTRVKKLVAPRARLGFDVQDAVGPSHGRRPRERGSGRHRPGEQHLPVTVGLLGQGEPEGTWCRVVDSFHRGGLYRLRVPHTIEVTIVLASASPRRADLLRAAGLTFDVRVVDADERRLNGEGAADYVARVAALKADGAPAGPGDIVIAADTAVVVDGDVFGKPVDAADAAGMLRRLSGRVHEVMTGVVVVAGGRRQSFVEVTRVWFHTLSEADIAWYVSSGEPMDKAGGYAVQGLASRFIPRIDGAYANVVGLPVSRVCQALRELDGGI